MFKQVVLTVEKFSQVPDNPIQRDSAEHGERFGKPPYGHLSIFHPTHTKVAMCVTPDGKHSWKLDGHTRMYCIEAGLLDWPKGQKLYVDVWTVKDAEEAAQFYMTYDGFGGSKETGSDKVFGAFRSLHFTPKVRTMWKTTGLIRSCQYLVFPRQWKLANNLTHTQLLQPWIETIRLIDAKMEPYHKHELFRSPFTTAQLCTMRYYGDDALEFWQRFHDDEGSRTATSMDGIYLARQLLHEHKNPVNSPMTTSGGRYVPQSRDISNVSAKVIFCCESFMEKNRFKNKLGRGNKRWSGMLSTPDWWADHIGEYDHPTLRSQQELELEK